MNRMIIDTETAGTFGKSLVYDFGGVIIDAKGNTLAKFNWVIDDVFNGMPRKMDTAYYANKLPQYRIEIAAGIREVITMADAFNRFNGLCREYDVREVWAYNAQFDVNALNYTVGLCSNGFVKSFVPAGITVKCIMGAFLSTMANGKYAKTAARTDAGNIKCSAEEAYRYIAGCPCFDEAHTALADAEIETVILLACLKRRRKMDTTPKGVMSFPAWQELQRKYK